jgi:hypothetical protein
MRPPSRPLIAILKPAWSDHEKHRFPALAGCIARSTLNHVLLLPMLDSCAPRNNTVSFGTQAVFDRYPTVLEDNCPRRLQSKETDCQIEYEPFHKKKKVNSCGRHSRRIASKHMHAQNAAYHVSDGLVPTCEFQPSLRSLAPNDKPGVPFSTTSVETPFAPWSPVLRQGHQMV